MMGTIYRQALWVVVWLGRASNLAGKEERFLEHWGPEPSLEITDLIDGLSFLEQSSWFHRSWTFQEVLLARDAVIRFGPYYLT